MWSEDPRLAYDLLADGCRQWSGSTTALDSIVGPAQQEQFVTGYRAQHINVFAPRSVVSDREMFGYLWDVTLPDGRVKTGIDVNVLQDSKIRENWTFVADGRKNGPDPDPGDRMSYRSMLPLVIDWAGERGYAVHRRPVLDPANGRAVVLRSSTAQDDAQVGGIDLLTIRDGLIEPIWSITGSRPFDY